MLTVPEAARRVGRNPETVRRWIRSGRLAARKIGTQHVIEEEALVVLVAAEDERLPVPESWRETSTGEPMPNVLTAIRLARAGR